MRRAGGSHLASRNTGACLATIYRNKRTCALPLVQTVVLDTAVFLDSERRVEVDMAVSRKETRSAKAFAVPLLGIALLLVCYWVLADWQELPTLMSRALASVHWPG